MKVFTFIKMLSPRKLISCLAFFIFITNFISGIVAHDKRSYKDIIEDFPAITDFDNYLSAVEKAVDFCIRHKQYVDINMQFGLFLIDVNLRQTLQQKRTNVPAKTRSRLENLFLKNEKLSNYFHSMVQKNQNVKKMGQDIKLTLLFYNATTWPTPSDKFNKYLLNHTNIYSPKQLNRIYGKWEDYYKNVNDFKKNFPSPHESDECLAFLVRTPKLNFGRSQSSCPIPPHCKLMIMKGSEFGYALTHRLLLLVIARFSRRCVVFSEKEDKLKTDTFCKKCFYEAEYIASNSFQVPDLIYEQIGLCGLFGHVQFIRNSWLKTLLEFQTLEGCFSPKIATGDYDENQMREDKNDGWKIDRKLDIMNGQCNAHFSSVAVASLSNALRYILETNY